MPKILLIAQGETIAAYGEELRREIDTPDDLEIVVSYMEDAVNVARRYAATTNLEIVIARGNTAAMVRAADLPLTVVDIPISDKEIVDCLREAQKVAGSGGTIGILGFKSVLSSVRSFLDVLGFPVFLYEIHSTEQTILQIKKAKKDGVSVLVGGVLTIELIEKTGLAAVLLDCSLNSIRSAYQEAGNILRALSMEKKKVEETRTILNSVSDAIVGVNNELSITMLNKNAEMVFGKVEATLRGRHAGIIFNAEEQKRIRQAIEDGDESIGAIYERNGKKNALRVVPITVEHAVVGAVITLQEIRTLQRIEATVRKGLYQTGNVARYTFDDLKGSSQSVHEAIKSARDFARLQSNVLIIGETGTGKEVFAQSIHNASERASGPFVAVNCGAIPAHLMESELFGYESGAFTGARKGGKMGLFELAHGGTIFLDEISEMDPGGQVNLLRVLQERQVRRVGAHDVVPIDVRVIAACNANLHEMVRERKFRQDLYYRLSVLVLMIPPLREREGDVRRLTLHFVKHYNEQFGKSISLSPDALDEMELLSWDGNIRQLRNFCERITAIADSPVLDRDFIIKHSRNCRPQAVAPDIHAQVMPSVSKNEVTSSSHPVVDGVVLRGRVFTRITLEDFLAQYPGDRMGAANALGISRSTLWRQLRRLGLLK